MSFASEKDQVPSYDEAIKTSTPPLSHAERIRQLQTLRVLNVLETHVLPFIESQTSEGLTQFSVILVPTNVDALQHHISSKTSVVVEKLASGEPPKGQQEAILGFPDHEPVKLLRLSDPADSSQFWQQPQVIQRLESDLRERLGIGNSQPVSPILQPAATSEKIKKKGFWSRKSSGPSSSSSPWDVNGVSSLGLAAMKKASQGVLAPGQMVATVSTEEVSLRTVSDFDLFEVRNGQAVVVRLRIGA